MSSVGNNVDDILDLEIDSDDEIVELKEIRRNKSAPTIQPRQDPNVSDSGAIASGSKRKQTSMRRKFFTTDPKSPGEYVVCKYCKTRIKCTSKNGTSSIKNHVTRCKQLPANLDKKQRLLDFEVETIVNEDGDVQTFHVPKSYEFSPETARKAIAKMVIVDELPFLHVECEGFRDFCKVMRPEFVVPSRATVTRDCYALFIEERKRLKTVFRALSSRVCLTTDTWTSGQNLSYMCLTAHFIDDSWRCIKEFLTFVQLSVIQEN